MQSHLYVHSWNVENLLASAEMQRNSTIDCKIDSFLLPSSKENSFMYNELEEIEEKTKLVDRQSIPFKESKIWYYNDFIFLSMHFLLPSNYTFIPINYHDFCHGLSLEFAAEFHANNANCLYWGCQTRNVFLGCLAEEKLTNHPCCCAYAGDIKIATIGK